MNKQDLKDAVKDFMLRGGRITVAAPRNAYGAQKKQKIKVPARFMGAVK